MEEENVLANNMVENVVEADHGRLEEIIALPATLSTEEKRVLVEEILEGREAGMFNCLVDSTEKMKGFMNSVTKMAAKICNGREASVSYVPPDKQLYKLFRVQFFILGDLRDKVARLTVVNPLRARALAGLSLTSFNVAKQMELMLKAMGALTPGKNLVVNRVDGVDVPEKAAGFFGVKVDFSRLSKGTRGISRATGKTKTKFLERSMKTTLTNTFKKVEAPTRETFEGYLQNLLDKCGYVRPKLLTGEREIHIFQEFHALMFAFEKLGAACAENFNKGYRDFSSWFPTLKTKPINSKRLSTREVRQDHKKFSETISDLFSFIFTVLSGCEPRGTQPSFANAAWEEGLAAGTLNKYRMNLRAVGRNYNIGFLPDGGLNSLVWAVDTRPLEDVFHWENGVLNDPLGFIRFVNNSRNFPRALKEKILLQSERYAAMERFEIVDEFQLFIAETWLVVRNAV